MHLAIVVGVNGVFLLFFSLLFSKTYKTGDVASVLKSNKAPPNSGAALFASLRSYSEKRFLSRSKQMQLSLILLLKYLCPPHVLDVSRTPQVNEWGVTRLTQPSVTTRSGISSQADIRGGNACDGCATCCVYVNSPAAQWMACLSLKVSQKCRKTD